MSEEIELVVVWIPDARGDHTEHVAGEHRIERIVLVADGRGPTGPYDRIHVYHKNRGRLVYPAHQCLGWQETRHG